MKTDKQAKWTALYERLSRDDDTFGDSVSIAHQKAYLRKYADEHGFANCHDYTDDGYSGGTFDRPAWNQMIADIEDGKVGTVIVKDMSRVGRDHLQTGFYTEIYFARNSVRFIAIDSRVDNARSDSNEFVPILNVFNEMYLHDQSRKTKIGFHAKGASGKPLMSTPNFGYLKDPENKCRWIIDPAAAETVRRIFELAAAGNNPNRIAMMLREERRVTPGAYFAERGQMNRCYAKKNATAYGWSRSTVVSLLQAREYLGETVNFKTAKASYKAKRMATTKDEQLVFAGTHEAIINSETWEKAQQMLTRRARPHATPTSSLWRGKVICARCGAPMYPLHQKVKLRNESDSLSEFFICSTHRNALDRIPESRYDALSAEYEAELSRTEETIAAENQQLEKLVATQDNAERFLELAREFRDCAEFTDEQLNLFTDRVIVHETVKDADGERSRRIEILLSFIGEFHIPAEPVELTPEEVKREEALKKRRIHERRKRKEKRMAKEADKQMT